MGVNIPTGLFAEDLLHRAEGGDRVGTRAMERPRYQIVVVGALDGLDTEIYRTES